MKKPSKIQDSETCYIGARVPKHVKDKLEAKRKRERRSLSATVEIILTQAVSTETL